MSTRWMVGGEILKLLVVALLEYQRQNNLTDEQLAAQIADMRAKVLATDPSSIKIGDEDV